MDILSSEAMILLFFSEKEYLLFTTVTHTVVEVTATPTEDMDIRMRTKNP